MNIHFPFTVPSVSCCGVAEAEAVVRRQDKVTQKKHFDRGSRVCFKVRPCVCVIRLLACLLFLYLPLDGTIGLQSTCVWIFTARPYGYSTLICEAWLGKRLIFMFHCGFLNITRKVFQSKISTKYVVSHIKKHKSQCVANVSPCHTSVSLYFYTTKDQESHETATSLQRLSAVCVLTKRSFKATF